MEVRAFQRRHLPICRSARQPSLRPDLHRNAALAQMRVRGEHIRSDFFHHVVAAKVDFDLGTMKRNGV